MRTQEALGVLKRWAYTTPIPHPGPRERAAFRVIRSATEAKLLRRRVADEMELFRAGLEFFIAVPSERVPDGPYRAARAMAKRAAEALGLGYPPAVRFIAEHGTPDWYAAEVHWGARADLWRVKGPRGGGCDGFYSRELPGGIWIKLGLGAWSTASVVAHEVCHAGQHLRLGEAMAHADRDELEAEANAFASAMMVGFREEDHS